MSDKKAKKKSSKKDKLTDSDKKAKSDEILESLFNDVKNSAEVFINLFYYLIRFSQLI